MKRCYYFYLPLLLILFILSLPACRREPSSLYPFGWTTTDPVFDTLTMRAERASLDMQPDSVAIPIIEAMEREAKKDPGSPEKLARYHYWHARMRLRHAEIDEAMEEFLVSLALTDSARFPYDVARIRWNMELDEPDDAEGYFASLEKLERFKEFNDLPMQAGYLMELGGLMNTVGNPASALRYFNSADSLLRIAGAYGQANRNVINRANSLERAGRDREAAALIKEALKDSLFCREPIAMNIALWNLYLVTDSLPVLQEAYRRLDGDLDEERMRPLYGSFLIKEYAKRGMKDSVMAMIPRVDADTAALDDPIFWRDYYLGRAAGERLLGNYEKATDLYAKGTQMMWEIDQNERADEIIRLEQRRAIDESIHRLALKQKDRSIWLMAALALCIVVAAGVIIIYRRRLEKQREEKLSASLAEEQAKRKALALGIAMEENRKFGENIRETVDSLEKRGLVTPSASGTLEATLKSHEISQQSQDSFVSTFSDVNPKFLEALDRKYPNLTKTERRLAVYISLGLDNKHISRLTGVRPESVKQARWRLRSKMGLPEDVSLEDEMKALENQ